MQSTPQRAEFAAFQNPATGQRTILQEHELEAYRRLSTALYAELLPATESERQLVQKIVDTHNRLNRMAAIETNVLNFSLAANTSTASHDDRTESIAAQARAFIRQSDTFDLLSRTESRLTRQLVLYTRELNRLQTLDSQTTEDKHNRAELASFGKKQAQPKTMTAQK